MQYRKHIVTIHRYIIVRVYITIVFKASLNNDLNPCHICTCDVYFILPNLNVNIGLEVSTCLLYTSDAADE